MNKLRIFCAVVFCLGIAGVSTAVELTGSVFVNETSDTATKAKNDAFNSARRSVVLRELRPYADNGQLEAAVKNSSDEDLMNIISSSSLDDEKISDTTYSANISFVIDIDAAKAWLEKNSVKHWLPVSTDSVVVVPVSSVMVTAVLLRPMADWMSLNSVFRGANIEFVPFKVTGNNIIFSVSEKDVVRVSSALRSYGWHVQSSNSGYKIWK